MPNSNALDPQSPQARAIYDLAIHSTVFVPRLFITTFLVILWSSFGWPDMNSTTVLTVPYRAASSPRCWPKASEKETLEIL